MTALHSRKFFRAGGFDQVQPDSGADLPALRELDQKLWGALSCPTRDTANEVLAAAEWAGCLLKNADLLVKGADSLALADIEKFIAGLEFNGDGVICPGQVADAGLRATIGDIAKCAGTAADLSGEVGISREIADKFLAEAEAYAAWYAKGESDPAVLLLGENTLAAVVAFHAVRDKVGDYFTRCQLAAYDARAAVPLSRAVEKMNIAAAFTAGDSDFLMVERNGVFHDLKGRDWNATIVRIVDHPISIRQAFWSPYKKLSKTISEQLQKFAASKAGEVEDKILKAVMTENEKHVSEAPATAQPKPPFDVGKFAGIFAAIGLAIGAIGGIVASVVSGIPGLKLWQIPLALGGLMLMVSGPSMMLAWFKLKRRNLGPILDVCGWAIDARMRINIPFGTALTGQAALPADAHRSPVEPFAEEKSLWPYYLIILAGIASLVRLWYVGFFGHR